MHLDDDTKTKVSEKIADLQARIADALAEGHRVDGDLAKAMAKSTGLPDPTPPATSLPELLGVPNNGPLRPGEVRNLGPVAGTDRPDAIPGIKAADLGEIITLPNGKQVAIFGDSYGEPHVSGKNNPHYSSVAVPVTFDKNGKPHFGPPLNGTTLRPGYGDESPGPNPLFPMPNEAMWAGANNTLPAGSITTKDGKTYMMVVGTNTNEGLAPKGGSWLVEVTNDPANGWKPVPGSYQPWQSIENPNAAPGTAPLISDPTKPPTQISGYQGGDGRIYIAADGFDRQQGVTMYSVDPEHVGDRNAWQPWTGSGWGAPGPDSAQHAAPLTGLGVNFGELSFHEVEGRPVISGFNGSAGNTEVRVGDAPTSIFESTIAKTIVAAGGPWGDPTKVPQNYGGYIMPGATLDNMGILISQWNTDAGAPYVVEQFQVHPNH